MERWNKMRQVKTAEMKPLCDCLWITQEVTRVPQSSAAQKHLFGPDGYSDPVMGGKCRASRSGGAAVGLQAKKREKKQQPWRSKRGGRRDGNRQRLDATWATPAAPPPAKSFTWGFISLISSPAQSQAVVAAAAPSPESKVTAELVQSKNPFPASLHFKMWRTGTCWLFLLFVPLCFSLLYIVATMHSHSQFLWAAICG